MGQLKNNYSVESDVARQVAERVYVLLLNGHFDAAHKAIDSIEVTKQDVKNAPLSDTPLALLDLDDKIINLFEKMGYTHVRDLVGVSDEHLLKTVPMCGEKTIQLLRQALTDEMTARRTKNNS
tara:strand:+ start:396 stop:764 length:369 start_codon:yes stop_codon:yes gene_type:complete